MFLIENSRWKKIMMDIRILYQNVDILEFFPKMEKGLNFSYQLYNDF